MKDTGDRTAHRNYIEQLANAKHHCEKYVGFVEESAYPTREPIFVDTDSNPPKAVLEAQRGMNLYRRQLQPYRKKIPDLWNSRTLATVEIPIVEERRGKPKEKTRPVTITGLKQLSEWTGRSLPRVVDKPGYGAHKEVRTDRAFMPPALMTAGLGAMNDAIGELNLAADIQADDYQDDKPA